MDNFLRLTDEKKKGQNRRQRVSVNPTVTVERIEKLKKTFQPFWMRGMILHSAGEDGISDGIDSFPHV
jgi:hypothetical protein